MAILQLESIDDVDPRMWAHYGMRFANGKTYYKIMNYEFTAEDVRSIVDFGDEYEIITATATVLIGKKFMKYEVKYK